MKKRSLITMLLALALVGAIGVGATLAYFTDSTNATNVVTMGHVDIKLTENGQNPGEGMTFTDVVPNKVLKKEPTITVDEGSLNCYVRATVSVTGLDGLAKDGIAYADQILTTGLNIDTAKWYKAADGYYYYNAEMAEGDDAVLFTEVKIPEKWGNEVVGKEFNIIVTAEAIQADSFEPTKNNAGMITAWTYTDGSSITAENYDDDATSTTPSNQPSDEDEVTNQQ